MPSSRAALRTRGRDHVRELTRHAVAELRAAGLPAAELRLLRRRGRVQDSAALSAAQRRANLAGTFLLDPRPARTGPGALLVLVDDVVTSGATLTEAAGVLAGAAPPGPCRWSPPSSRRPRGPPERVLPRATCGLSRAEPERAVATPSTDCRETD